MTRGSSTQLGNVGVRMVACVTVIVLLVVFFAVNYVRLMSMEKESHTAVEAACLQAARDLSAVVVDGPVGRLSLVDDLPVKRPYIPNRNIYTDAIPKGSAKSEEVRQVKSVNTLLAEIRLRALIASQPDIANSTMLYRAGVDLDLARESISALKIKLTNALAHQMTGYDKAGRVINIQSNAVNAYTNNQQKLGRIYSRLENLSFRLGTLSNRHDAVISSLHTPRPADSDPQTIEEDGFYKAYKKYYIPGLPGQKIEFMPDCPSPRLVDNAAFVPLQGEKSIPCAVQLEGDEVVTMISPGGNDQPQTSRTHFRVTAQCPAGPIAGAENQLEASPSGALLLSFPQGFPVLPADAGFNFNSLVNIMNASMLDLDRLESKSPYRIWNKQSAGVWRVAQNGTVPGSGMLVDKPYLNIKSRGNDDPSVALSFLVYDWLASLGLKPNVQSVVKALTFDLQADRDYRHNPSIEFSSNAQLPNIQPAAAEPSPRSSIVTAILNVDPTGKNDPRNLTNWPKNPRLYERQQSRMWGYVGPLSAFPADAMLVKISNDGSVSTMDGNSVNQAAAFMREIIAMNHIGWQTYVNTLTVLNQRIASRFESLKEHQVPATSVTNTVIEENPRLANALANAQYCMAISTAMKKNLRALTANGIRMVNQHQYSLDAANFNPPTKAATVEQLSGQTVCDIGQCGLSVKGDWCGAKPTFISGSKITLTAQQLSNRHYLPQVNAYSQANSNLNKFLFHLDLQSPSKQYQGKINMHRLEASPYAAVPLIKGQVHYQNTCALITDALANSAYKICWQVQARDLNANHFNNNEAASYFADMDLNSYNGQVCKTSPMHGVCPPLVSEFAFLCPLVKAPMPELPTNIALWSDWLAPSVVSSSMANQLISVDSGWQPSIYTPDGTALGSFKGRLSEKAIDHDWWQGKRWKGNWWLTSGKLYQTSGSYPEPPPLAI